jgi:transposase
VTPGQQRIAELEEENATLRKRVVEREREVGALREELAKLRKEIEEWKRGFRERGKRRTSGPEGRRPGTGKPRGRKAGHVGSRPAAPSRIDEEVEYPMPALCGCGGAVVSTGETDSAIVIDIPPVQPKHIRHVAHVGRCKRCKTRVVAKLPGAPATGKSVAHVSLGPNVQAMALGLRFEQDVPLGKIGAFLGQWFGIAITSGGLSQMFCRLRRHSAPSYDELVKVARASPVVGLDESGHRQEGVPGWVWLMRTDRVSVFRVELSRAAWVADAMLGADFKGVVCSDFYGVYTRRADWVHGYCGAHTIREAKKLAELEPCVETEEFRDRLTAFYVAGKAAATSGDAGARRGARIRLGRIINSTDWVGFPDIVRLQERLDVHKAGVTLFIDRPDVPATNNATEGDIRAHARHRAMTGGTRSPSGSATYAHWMSITQTRRKNALPLRGFITGLYASHLEGRSPPSVFAVGDEASSRLTVPKGRAAGARPAARSAQLGR